MNTQGTNKWDEMLGVTALVPLFGQGRIDIPNRGEPGKLARVNRRRLNNFVDVTKSKRGRAIPSDLVTASWFPLPRMLKMFDRTDAPLRLVVAPEPPYPQYGGNQAPWGVSAHPDPIAYPGQS